MRNFIEQLTRRKVVDYGHSELRRVLGVVDLTMLGVGSTIGVGIYVLAGQVSRGSAGPAVTISFLIAAIASLFAGLCYAEFGARVPKAGSAYIYTYVCIGEFVAFIIGWNLILEYVIGTASVARGFSQYVDALANNSIEDALYDAMPLIPEYKLEDESFLSSYPDFLSFGLAIVLSVALALGVKESSRMNNIFTSINIIVITFVIIAGGYNANPYNWRIPSDEIDDICNVTLGKESTWGTGGFAPFGFTGIMEGAATCFFGFVGFDIIATTGEEALNPSRNIPLSIGISLLIIFLSYFGVSAVITLAIPYCLQDEDAPLVVLFDQDHIGWEWAKWFVSIGALFGFSASLFGAMFPLPRVIYAMASDGLVFRTLASISKKFQTPTYATALSGLFAGAMAMLFNLDALVDMMSIGTLMAYSIVALCVMLLRYTVNDDEEEGEVAVTSSTPSTHQFSDYLNQLFNRKGLTKPTDLTASVVTYAILCFCVLVVVLDALLVGLQTKLSQGDGGAIAAIVIVGVLNIINLVVIACQPQSDKKLSFKVPLVPWLPAFSTFINMYLMCSLDSATWIRFGVWMTIGFLDYFAYGLWHSSLRKGRNTGHGLDNMGYAHDNPKNHQLIIPKIEIQPATPLSSEPNTPATKPKVQTTPVPTSPLATAETQGSQDTTEDPKKSSTSEHDGNVPVLDAAAVVASLMLSGEVVDGEEKGKDMEGKESADVERKDQGEVGSGDKMLRGSGSPGDENVKPNGDIVKGSEDAADSVPSLPTDRKTGEDVKAEDKKTEDDSSTKDKLGKPPPLILPSTDHGDDDKDASGIPRAYYSSPELSPPHSPPPSPPPSTPTSPPPPLPSSSPPSKPHPVLVRSQSEAALNRNHSVPTTPVGRRHPVKVLRRMSSFDDIPPRSPDSPFAKRVDKFVVIPVHAPEMDSNENSISPSPTHSPSISPFTTKDPEQDNLIKAVDKLNKYKKDEDKKMFTVGSADSLDSFAGDLSEPSEFLTPRRGVSREPDMLDPIRERGESKLYANDTDKTEIQPS